MKRGRFKVSATLLGIVAAACATDRPRIHIHPDLKVPAEFALQTIETPAGESERFRYLNAYEAFWYNCLAMLAENLDARCPASCGGTPAAGAGCARGSADASNQTKDATTSYGAARTQQALRLITADPEAMAKRAAYFGERPPAEYEFSPR